MSANLMPRSNRKTKKMKYDETTSIDLLSDSYSFTILTRIAMHRIERHLPQIDLNIYVVPPWRENIIHKTISADPNKYQYDIIAVAASCCFPQAGVKCVKCQITLVV